MCACFSGERGFLDIEFTLSNTRVLNQAKDAGRGFCLRTQDMLPPVLPGKIFSLWLALTVTAPLHCPISLPVNSVCRTIEYYPERREEEEEEKKEQMGFGMACKSSFHDFEFFPSWN